MAETTEKTIEIRLRSGAKIRTRDGGAGTVGLDGLHRELQQSEFVRIGGDTIVRSADVESLQIKEDGKDKRRESATRHHSPARPRRRRLVETRPFFLTSEFVLAFAAWVALLLTSLATDSVDGWTFALLTVAIAAGYMMSRGFAKAHAASEAWDPREEVRAGS